MAAENHFAAKRYLGPAASLVLFAAAAWLLHRELAAYRLKDILHNLSLIPSLRIWGAVLLTAASYGVMTAYDALALRYIQQPIGYTKSALASFTGYAFSNNIGLSMIAGASVRYRLYSAWGLSVIEISQVIFFCTVSFWLGFFLLFGLMSVVSPTAVPESMHLPFASTRWLGLFCLAIVAGLHLGGRHPEKTDCPPGGGNPVAADRACPLAGRHWRPGLGAGGRGALSAGISGPVRHLLPRSF